MFVEKGLRSCWSGLTYSKDEKPTTRIMMDAWSGFGSSQNLRTCSTVLRALLLSVARSDIGVTTKTTRPTPIPAKGTTLVQQCVSLQPYSHHALRVYCCNKFSPLSYSLRPYLELCCLLGEMRTVGHGHLFTTSNKWVPSPSPFRPHPPLPSRN